jgi:hypothetical protein
MVSGIMLIRFPQRFGLKFNWTALYRFCNLRETIFSYSAGQRVGETANQSSGSPWAGASILALAACSPLPMSERLRGGRTHRSCKSPVGFAMVLLITMQSSKGKQEQ